MWVSAETAVNQAHVRLVKPPSDSSLTEATCPRFRSPLGECVLGLQCVRNECVPDAVVSERRRQNPPKSWTFSLSENPVVSWGPIAGGSHRKGSVDIGYRFSQRCSTPHEIIERHISILRVRNREYTQQQREGTAEIFSL